MTIRDGQSAAKEVTACGPQWARHRNPLNAHTNADPSANTKAGGTSAKKMAD